MYSRTKNTFESSEFTSFKVYDASKRLYVCKEEIHYEIVATKDTKCEPNGHSQRNCLIIGSLRETRRVFNSYEVEQSYQLTNVFLSLSNFIPFSFSSCIIFRCSLSAIFISASVPVYSLKI